MADATNVLEFKCPCCNAGLRFDGNSQKLNCEYCGNSFDLDAVQTFNESQTTDTRDIIEWEEVQATPWSQEEEDVLKAFQCPSCGGEILTEATTAASFCPYCGNPTILPSRLSGSIRPDALIPFRKTKEDAKAAFLQLCKKKPLFPKGFPNEQQLEKITGLYVPFWLYDCEADFSGSYKATRTHIWSDSRCNYTKTDHFLLKRQGGAAFSGIPMDGSQKMDDTFMESIEPYNYGELAEFDMAYLTGFLADKYDVPSEAGENRIRQRVDNTIREELQSTFLGYNTVGLLLQFEGACGQ